MRAFILQSKTRNYKIVPEKNNYATRLNNHSAVFATLFIVKFSHYTT